VERVVAAACQLQHPGQGRGPRPYQVRAQMDEVPGKRPMVLLLAQRDFGGSCVWQISARDTRQGGCEASINNCFKM